MLQIPPIIINFGDVLIDLIIQNTLHRGRLLCCFGLPVLTTNTHVLVINLQYGMLYESVPCFIIVLKYMYVVTAVPLPITNWVFRIK